VLTRAGGHIGPQQVRTVLLPEDDGIWLTVEQVATVLELPPSEVIELVDRDAIPFYLVQGGVISRPEYLRFRRDEIDAWTIG
jgi:hypothetical protein